MKRTVFWIALAVLVVFHHDWWFWTDGTLLFGFLPVGLAYHAVISLIAAAMWAVAAFYAMPEVFENDTEEAQS